MMVVSPPPLPVMGAPGGGERERERGFVRWSGPVPSPWGCVGERVRVGACPLGAFSCIGGSLSLEGCWSFACSAAHVGVDDDGFGERCGLPCPLVDAIRWGAFAPDPCCRVCGGGPRAAVSRACCAAETRDTKREGFDWSGVLIGPR